MSIRRAGETQTQTSEAYEVTVINSGEEDGEAELFTLDDGYQQVARQSLHVAAGQRVQATVIAPLSSGKVTPARSRGRSSLALASGSGVTIVPLKAR